MEIFYIFAIIALTVVIVVKEILSYKERIVLAKVNKAKDVQEINYLFPEQEEPKAVEEDDSLIGMESIVEVLDK